jgi:hypothetical protein
MLGVGEKGAMMLSGGWCEDNLVYLSTLTGENIWEEATERYIMVLAEM